jgi:hypothetical protein
MFKDGAMVVRQDLHSIAESKAACFNGSDGLFGRRAQFGCWAIWLSYDSRSSRRRAYNSR